MGEGKGAHHHSWIFLFPSHHVYYELTLIYTIHDNSPGTTRENIPASLFQMATLSAANRHKYQGGVELPNADCLDPLKVATGKAGMQAKLIKLGKPHNCLVAIITHFGPQDGISKSLSRCQWPGQTTWESSLEPPEHCR